MTRSEIPEPGNLILQFSNLLQNATARAKISPKPGGTSVTVAENKILRLIRK